MSEIFFQMFFSHRSENAERRKESNKERMRALRARLESEKIISILLENNVDEIVQNVEIRASQNFWQYEIDQQLSKYKHLCMEVNKMLKAVDLPASQKIKRKLPARMETLLELMEDKILDTTKEIQENISKGDLELINFNYKKAKDYVTTVLLARYARGGRSAYQFLAS